MDKNQEYYNSSYGYVKLFAEVTDKPEFVVITGGDEGEGVLQIARRDSLVKKEESYRFIQETKRADEIRAITAKAQENFDQLVEKLIKKATGQLASRMKFNAVFGNNMGSAAGWAVQIADELNKLVKENAEEVIKDKKDIF